MEILQLKQESLSEWAKFIPKELVEEWMYGRHPLYAAGITFQDEPQGALCWEENEKEWVLRSIYIHPEYRRMRLGSELVVYLSDRMKEKNCRQLTVSYEPEGERVTLTPFLDHCGFLVESMDIPVGVTTLGQVIASLKEHNAFQKKGRIRRLGELLKQERYICSEWLFHQIGEDLRPYVKDHPSSFVLMKEDEVNGILLLNELNDSISLDYCWVKQESAASLLSLLAVGADELYKHYPENKQIEMILATDQAKKLYSRLLGEVSEQMILCKGYFEPLPRELILWV